MRRMGLPSSPASLCFCLLVVVVAAPPSSLLPVSAEDPYRFYTWNITFGDIYPLGVKQEARLCSRSDCFHCCDKWAERWIQLHLSLLTMLVCVCVDVMQGILINGQFPGPQIDAVTNDNIVVNVFNNLPVPFLLSW
jgi:hypothetical protein